MTETGRVVATAALLSIATISTFAWRVARIDRSQPERLIGELRVAQWAALFLAAIGGASIGLAIGGAAVPLSNADVALGAIFVGIAGIVLQREPREALAVVSGALVLHALVSLAHRPGWLSPEIVPHWFAAGCAMYDVYIAGLCFWLRLRP